MSDKFLSQEEIDSLLRKNNSINNVNDIDDLSSQEKDILGEVGNISMSTSATTLSTLLNRSVDITTPRVSITTFNDVVSSFELPYVILQVQFDEGLHGTNVLLMSIKDASIISNLMMGGDGTTFNEETLSELELSAVSEAMNQMIGSASTAVATMLSRKVDIDPPLTQIGNHDEPIQIKGIEGDTNIACIVFRLTIGDLVDSEIMQLYTLNTAREISDIMMGSINTSPAPKPTNAPQRQEVFQEDEIDLEIPRQEEKREYEKKVQVQQPEFVPLKEKSIHTQSRNIDLILDVPLELSAILGRTKKSIKEVLSLEPGSIVELNKYAEEPLDIYVNGKLIAQGEVVVLEEKFGIRINSIVSAKERVETLK